MQQRVVKSIFDEQDIKKVTTSLKMGAGLGLEPVSKVDEEGV